MRVNGDCRKGQLFLGESYNMQPFSLGLPCDSWEEQKKNLTKHKQKIRSTENIRPTKRPKSILQLNETLPKTKENIDFLGRHVFVPKTRQEGGRQEKK